MNKSKALHATVATICTLIGIAICISIGWLISTYISPEALLFTIIILFGIGILFGLWKSFYDN
jgi:hypothetical protein